MGEAQEGIEAISGKRQDQLDNILNVTLGVLVTAILLLGVYFGYSVYLVRMEQENATPALRVIQMLKTQVRQSPNDAALRVRLGEAYAAAGKADEAIEQLKNALKIEPEHTGAFLDLGLLAITQQDYDAAERYLTKVIDLTEGSEFADVNNRRETALYNLGLLAIADNRFEDAIGYFKSSLRIKKDASDTYYYLARAYFGIDEYDAAEEQLMTALAFDPNFAQAHFLLGQIYAKQKDDINAAIHYQLAAELAPDADPPAEALASYGTVEERIAAAEKALADGDTDSALHEALMATAIAPKSVDALLVHAKVLGARKDYKGALQVYASALKLDPANAEAKTETARLAPLAGK